MKYYSNQISEIASGIKKSEILSCLIYGPDTGLIDYSLNKIASDLNLPKRSVSYSNISADELRSTLDNISLFGTKEIIKLTDIKIFDAKLKEVTKEQHHNILIIISEELTPSSALRKTFETEKNLASIACYHDDAASVEKIVKKACMEAKKLISSDALKYLSHGLYGDRYIILNELEKLLTYASDKNEITLEDVLAVISSSTTPEPDLLCIYFFKHDQKLYFQELNKLLAENTPAVWIVRALTRYAINIYFVLEKMSDGMSIDDAVSSLTPPIFFKYIADFKKIIRSFDTEKILNIMRSLYKAEVKLKSSIMNEKLICEELLIVSLS